MSKNIEEGIDLEGLGGHDDGPREIVGDEALYQAITEREVREREFHGALADAQKQFESATDEGERHDLVVYIGKLQAGLKELEAQLDYYRSHWKPPQKHN